MWNQTATKGSGKSRSLMREVSNKISSNPDKYKNLKLMVVHKKSEKKLEDILGAASEEATLICYRDATPYRYRGKFRAQNVLASVYHLISQQTDEFPIKHIKSRESLLSFLNSTDRSFLLLETCGWSARLLSQSNQSFFKEFTFEDGILFGKNSTSKAEKSFSFSKDMILKDLNYEKLTCDSEFELGESIWPEYITWSNKSTLMFENSGGVNGMPCSVEEFQRFKLFFSSLMTLARDYFLPPEKQRFGFVSSASLIPLLDIQDTPGWFLFVQYAGCPNCSEMIRDSEILKDAVVNVRSLVTELQDQDYEFEPALPADKSSIVLFVDRTSESAKVRRRSVSALGVFRNLAFSSHSLKSERSGEAYSLKNAMRSSDLGMRVSAAQKPFKFKKNMAFVITNDGEAVALRNLADGLRSQSPASIFSYLLKGPKMCLLAKKAGFQLLSDDFDVKLVDSSLIENKVDHSDESVAIHLNLNSDLAGKSTGLVSGREPLSMANNDDAFSGYSEPINVDTTASSQRVEIDSSKMKDTNFDRSVEEKKEANLSFSMIDNGNAFSGHSEAINKDTATSSQKDEIGSSDIAKSNSHVLADEVYEVDLVVPADNTADLFKGPEGDAELPFRVNQQRVQHILMGEDKSQAHYHVTTDDSDVHIGDFSDKFSKSSKSFPHEKFPKTEHQFSEGSFYYSDGGSQLLRSLSSTTHVPSAVIFDPILRQHFVYPKDKAFNHSSLVHFVQDYYNGKLSAYHKSEPDVFNSKDFLHSPLVNFEFHDADSIPRATTNTFSSMVLGYDLDSKQTPGLNFVEQNLTPAWRKDVLVLLGNAGCGFCLKMELLVQEVYRALKGYESSFPDGSGSSHSPGVDVDASLNKMPSIVFMDCTLNDCSNILHSLNQIELFPALILFPAENKSAIPYQGELSVSGIFEFLAAHGARSHFLYESVGKLWTRSEKEHVIISLMREESSVLRNSQPLVKVHDHNEVPEASTVSLPTQRHSFNKSNVDISAGTLLIATNKLVDSPPFDNSTILIVKADKNTGFQGVIVNKRISWDLLNDENEELLPLKKAPLYFGGPLVNYGMPLVSLVQSPADDGYLEVFPDFHFGDHVATSHAIKQINSGDKSADNYWFFLGCSSWDWNQLFDELSEGAWNLSNYQLTDINWLGG